MSGALNHLPRFVMIRRTCALAALLALFVQGSNGGHMLLVQHTRCAAHGELVHAGPAHEHAATEPPLAVSAEVRGTPDVGSTDAHEHCSVSSNRRDALVAMVDTEPSEPLCEASQDAALCGAIAVSRTPRFRIAPKNSPPA
jgi:hypothetical protein